MTNDLKKALKQLRILNNRYRAMNKVISNLIEENKELMVDNKLLLAALKTNITTNGNQTGNN